MVEAPAPGGSAPAQASSISAPPPDDAALISEMEQELTLPAPPPSSMKSVRYPARPGYGKVGEKVQVWGNHFIVEVWITSEIASKKINRMSLSSLFVCSRSLTWERECLQLTMA
ncbi:hypothetical protein ACFX11_030082 [Malus domestica]